MGRKDEFGDAYGTFKEYYFFGFSVLILHIIQLTLQRLSAELLN